MLTILLWIAIAVCRSLTNIFNLRRNEAGITWCQISILLAIGLWIVGFVIIFDMKNNPRIAAGFGILGTVISWIFQDTIKGVVAFIHLRLNNLLHIGDWIMVPSRNVDGEVKRVTLTTVTIYNWDTTTSSIPTGMLHSEHFQNLQNMMTGKTYGRKMSKCFIMDTGWFHNMSQTDLDELRNKGDVRDYLPEECMKCDVTNAQLFRQYLFYWLMNHHHISQLPRLIVRWQEQKESGLPLEVYAFITDSSLAAFEWQQSQIIEHIIESMAWFGLRLYQSPSAYDVSNSNVFLTDKPATYRMEDQ
ncbi:MAG: mechanosensitive ion channel [Prevotella sp.]|nr:mechanosensitive ion channel [Prevotella sp.]